MTGRRPQISLRRPSSGAQIAVKKAGVAKIVPTMTSVKSNWRAIVGTSENMIELPTPNPIKLRKSTMKPRLRSCGVVGISALVVADGIELLLAGPLRRCYGDSERRRFVEARWRIALRGTKLVRVAET